jgi:hypothetical protein
MLWHRVQRGAALWVVLSLAAQLESDAARQSGPSRAPLWEPIATGVAIITGVMVVVGCALAEDRIPYRPATAGNHTRAL